MKLSLLCVAILVGLLAPSAMAEELDDYFKRANEYVSQKNYAKAMEEIDWAKKEVEKMHVQKLQEFFPADLQGYKGQKFSANAALGITNLERNYTKGGANNNLKVSLTGGSGNSAAGLGGLAQLGRMAAMMQGGGGTGQETVRIAGRTAQLETSEEGKDASLTVFLNSGSVLKLELSGSADGSTLRRAAEGIKLNELDAYLSGSGQ